MKPLERRHFVVFVVLCYALFSVVWIVLTDRLLSAMPSQDAVEIASTAKGLLFVVISALFLAWGMIRIPDRNKVDVFPGLSLDLSYDLGARGWRRLLGNYLPVILLVICSVILRAVLPESFSQRPMLVLFLPAIILSAFLGGTGPGLLSTALLALSTLIWHGKEPITGTFLLQWLMLVCNGLLASMLSGALLRSRLNAHKDRQILSLTLGSLEDALIASDKMGQIVYANPAAERLLCRDLGAMLGKPVAEIVCLSGEGEAQNLVRTHQVSLETQVIPVLVRRTPISLSDGRSGGDLLLISDQTDKARSEAVLRDERRRLRTLIDSMPDLVWVKDVQGRYQICNPMFERFVGVREAELVDKTDYDLVSADQADFFRANDRMALLSGASRINTEWLTMAVDGRSILVETVKTPVLDRNGVPVAILGVARDITASWQTQQRLTLALTAAGMGVWEWNIRSDQILWSPECSRITGLDRQEMMFEDFRSIIHMDDVVETVAASRRSLSLGERFHREFRILRADGAVRWVSVQASPHYDDAGIPLRLIGTVVDVTDKRNQAEELERYRHHLEEEVALRTEELRSAEGRFGMILDTTGDGLMGADTEGLITFVNPAACRILGYEKEELLGAKGHELFHHSHADGSHYPIDECPVVQSIRSGQEVRQFRDTYWRKDGSPVVVTNASHPMIRNGKVVGAVISFTDISGIIAAEAAREEALREAERLANVRREFLANMSHEIRTPLNAILGLAHIGRRESAGRKAQGNFQCIIEAGHTLLGLVNDVLDFSKIEAGHMKIEQVPVLLGGVIDRSLLLISGRAFEKAQTLLVEEDPALPPALVSDPLRLAQVIGNLLSNAVKFTPGGGRIRLALSCRDGQLEILVEDSGIGMSEELVARLFRPFEQADGSTTRNFGGTGLGLSITRSLVEIMGGVIRVESKPGQGSRFTVTLPLTVADTPLRPLPQPGTIALMGLEDDEAACLADELRRRGFASMRIDLAEQLPPEAALALPAERLLGEEGVALRRRLPAGCRILAVVTPGHGPGWEQGQAIMVERPLRARLLIEALIASDAASGMSAGGVRRLSGLRFLLAEDNEVNRLVMNELLDQEGAKVLSAENGSKALALLTTEGVDAFDMLLTDIQMPDIDGYELTRRVKQLAPQLPVIGVTANAMSQEQQLCLDAGMCAYVAKPVDPDQLVEAIQQNLPARSVAEMAMEEGLGIDWAALEARYQGKELFVTKLLGTVERAHGETAGELRRLAAAFDLERLAFVAHGLKGSAGNLMAEGLRQLALETEHAARDGLTDTAPRLAGMLADALDALLADIRAHLADDGGKLS